MMAPYFAIMGYEYQRILQRKPRIAPFLCLATFVIVTEIGNWLTQPIYNLLSFDIKTDEQYLAYECSNSFYFFNNFFKVLFTLEPIILATTVVMVISYISKLQMMESEKHSVDEES